MASATAKVHLQKDRRDSANNQNRIAILVLGSEA